MWQMSEAQLKSTAPPGRRFKMRYAKYFMVLGLFVLLASTAKAQVAVGVGIDPYYGPAPVCTYGYYGFYTYACAPYGY